LINLVNGVLVGHVTGLVRVTILALDHGRAFLAVVPAAGLVDGAGLVCDIFIFHVLIGIHWLTTVAPIVHSLARNQYLGTQVHVRPSGLSHNLDSIRKG